MLEKQSAKALITALQTDLDALLKQENDESAAKLYATLGLAQKALPEKLRPLLILLGLHERFIQLDSFGMMAKQVSQNWSTDKIRRFADSLSYIGLLHDRGKNVYELHPALTGYLRAFVIKSESESIRNEWTKAFVIVMGRLADNLTPKELHEKRFSFYLFEASFYFAMNESRRIGMDLYYRMIVQSLAFYNQHTHNYKETEDLFLRLAASCKIAENLEWEAAAYHQLGVITQERRSFDAAEKWYRKALEINEKYGNERIAAKNYHQLGYVAQERRDLDAAENWYRKSLEISEKHGNDHGAASTYGQLGIIAGLQGHFEESGKWLIKAILLFSKCNAPSEVQRHANNFMAFYNQASPETQANLKALWENAGLGELPSDE